MIEVLRGIIVAMVGGFLLAGVISLMMGNIQIGAALIVVVLITVTYYLTTGNVDKRAREKQNEI